MLHFREVFDTFLWISSPVTWEMLLRLSVLNTNQSNISCPLGKSSFGVRDVEILFLLFISASLASLWDWAYVMAGSSLLSVTLVQGVFACPLAKGIHGLGGLSSWTPGAHCFSDGQHLLGKWCLECFVEVWFWSKQHNSSSGAEGNYHLAITPQTSWNPRDRHKIPEDLGSADRSKQGHERCWLTWNWTRGRSCTVSPNSHL